jgi:hypothetical protein
MTKKPNPKQRTVIIGLIPGRGVSDEETPGWFTTFGFRDSDFGFAHAAGAVAL